MTDFVDIKIASTLKDLTNAFSLRKEIFVEKEGVPDYAEFDGNDLSATHVLAYVNEKPVGTIRIRYFKDFVKFERICVVPEYRKTNVAGLMVETASKFCALKGYDTAYWLCQKALIDRWSQIGAFPIKGCEPSAQHGMVLTAMGYKLPEANKRIDIMTSPEILNKKEGEWFTGFEIDTETEVKRQKHMEALDALHKKVQNLKLVPDAKLKEWRPPFKYDAIDVSLFER